MARRRLWVSIAAVALAAAPPGGALAEGWGALDMVKGSEVSALLADAMAQKRKVDPGRLPPAVTAAAQAAVRGFQVGEAYWTSHRSFDSWREMTGFTLKGRDASGREVTVHTSERGGSPTAIYPIPLDRVADDVLAGARDHAARFGYTLTSATLLVRNDRSFGRAVQRRGYYLKGSHPDRPRVERLVWVSEDGRFRLRQLDEAWRIMVGN
jgi:hypothetical protein